MKKEKKKYGWQAKGIMITFALVVALLIAESYAWMLISRTSTTVNKITAGSLDLILDESSSEGILLQNTVPMSFQQGIETTAYTFKLKNNSQTPADYTISLEDFYDDVTVPTEGKIADSKIRYILLKDDETAQATNSKLLSTGRAIETGKIEGTTEISYTLYVWIDSQAGAEVNNQIFSGRLNITAEQAAPTYVVSGTVTDGNGTPVNGGTVVAFSDSIYSEVSSTGTFTINNLPSGTHTIYYVPGKTVAEVTNKTAEEIEMIEGYGKTTYNTDSNSSTLNFSNGYILSSLTVKVVKNNSKNIKIGDYIQMTPTKTSYTTDTSMTGYSTEETINPSELNLWRVINVNSNGTYDAISVYLSSNTITFNGDTGYNNLVGYLNIIASQYENSKFTVGSRHVGYNGQTEFIPENCIGEAASTPALTAGDNVGEEYDGGCSGDTMYARDKFLIVSQADMRMVAYPVGTTSYASNWLASRSYYYNAGSMYRGANIVYPNAGIRGANSSLWLGSTPGSTKSLSRNVRPIVVFKSDINPLSGNGTEDSPYVLN